jgi:tripartite-type tricarboxylate transporter receptor subunit TctC
VRAGRLRALAVSTAKRSPILPDVPTVAEATGMKDYEVDSWYAVFGPAKMPHDAILRTNKELAAVLARPEVKARLLEQGAEAAPSTPEALAQRVHREIAEWQALVKRVPIEAD